MALNRNNFLRWTGSFLNSASSFILGGLHQNFFANIDSITFNPLVGSSASLGINPFSFQITSITDLSGTPIILSQDCNYDGTNLTVYRPIDLTLTAFRINFEFQDYLGVSSLSGAFWNILMSTISTSWIEYPISDVCLLDNFGNNNGYRSWTQLQLVNSATMTPISPLTLKPNVVSDPDYQPPVLDAITCPSPNLPYSTLFISNFSLNGSDPLNYILITNIFLSSPTLGTGGTPISINIPCTINPGNSRSFFVPSGTWTSGGLTISYTVFGNMVSASPQRYWRVNAGGVVSYFPNPPGTISPVDNSGIYGNFDITIPVTSGGITVFAQ